MRRFSRQALGVIAILPGLWVLVLACEHFLSPGHISLDAGMDMHFHLFIVTLFAITWTCFIFHAIGSPVVPAARRALWVLLLLAGTIATMPVYWYFYLRPDPSVRKAG